MGNGSNSELRVLKANLRWRRAIYAWITIGGGISWLGLALYLHLEERVLPRVPIRHWICSLPWGLRALLGYDKKLCAAVVSGFMKEVDRSLRWRVTLGNP